MLTQVFNSASRPLSETLPGCVAILLLPLLFCSCGKQTHPKDSSEAPETVKMSPHGSAISIVSVGDVLLGSAASGQLSKQGFDWPFEQVRTLLSSADLVIGNLAAPITGSSKKLSGDKEYAYKLTPASAAALKRAGFHALALGNNHVLDYGLGGMRDTVKALRSNDLLPFGAGENEKDARRGVVYDFGTIRIGFLAFGEEASEPKAIAKNERAGYALLSEKNLAEDIERMRAYADVVVVSSHWGKNYKDVLESQHKIGRRAIELGADIVCGHHPHVAQGIEIYRGKPIFYSLGNFVFGTRGRYSANKQAYGLVSRWVFEGKMLKWILATPIGVNNELVKFQPARVQPDEARQALETHLGRYGTEVRWQGDTACIGFAAGWQSAALPTLPWNQAVATTASNDSPVAGLPVSVNK